MRERYLPIVATISVFLVLCLAGALLYRHFLSPLVFGNLLTDNAFIIIAAIGTTFVILSGGIDLSVGAMIGFVGVVMASLIAAGWHPLAAAAVSVVFGAVFGAGMGFMIDFCEIQPFMVTLAGMFLLRGLCFIVSLDSVPIHHPFVDAFADWHIPLGAGGRLSASAVAMLVLLGAGIIIAHQTRFGTNVYAIGGDRGSAALMGVPIRRTMMSIYALGGIYSALGGVIYAFYTASGYPLAGTGDELDAIAAVVLGGTLLTGGVGFVAGTLFGGLIQGVIQTLIAFDGSLTSWWTKIAIGALLFLFIVLQQSIVGSFAAFRRVA
ncbi:MAG: galactofuranose ABC transporter, permease protein YjfF [Stellaceae bacterium]